MNALDLLRSFFSYSFTRVPSNITPLCDYVIADALEYATSLVGFRSLNRTYVNSEWLQLPNYKAHNVGLWFTERV